MPQYLLDTNHLSPLVTLTHPLRVRILRQIDRGDEFAIPVVVLSEFLFGIQLIPRAKNNNLEWERLQHYFGYYDISRRIAEEAANLQVSMRQKGRQLGTLDALIAIIALHNNLILLTKDRDFESVLDLRSENWLTSHS